MNKELTPLEALKEYRNQQLGVNVYADDYLDIIEKSLKALDIIKNNLNITEILLAIKGVCSMKEYDLVREVLL